MKLRTLKPSHIKRPLNAFFIYCDEIKAYCEARGYKAPPRRYLGKTWKEGKQRSEAFLEYYNERQKIKQLEHASEHPNWKFSPKRRKKPRKNKSKHYPPERASSRYELTLDSNVDGMPVHRGQRPVQQRHTMSLEPSPISLTLPMARSFQRSDQYQPAPPEQFYPSPAPSSSRSLCTSSDEGLDYWDRSSSSVQQRHAMTFEPCSSSLPTAQMIRSSLRSDPYQLSEDLYPSPSSSSRSLCTSSDDGLDHCNWQQSSSYNYYPQDVVWSTCHQPSAYTVSGQEGTYQHSNGYNMLPLSHTNVVPSFNFGENNISDTTSCGSVASDSFQNWDVGMACDVNQDAYDLLSSIDADLFPPSNYEKQSDASTSASVASDCESLYDFQRWQLCPEGLLDFNQTYLPNSNEVRNSFELGNITHHKLS